MAAGIFTSRYGSSTGVNRYEEKKQDHLWTEYISSASYAAAHSSAFIYIQLSADGRFSYRFPKI
jgi:hypothetical protein